jgi:hypothetical protein
MKQIGISATITLGLIALSWLLASYMAGGVITDYLFQGMFFVSFLILGLLSLLPWTVALFSVSPSRKGAEQAGRVRHVALNLLTPFSVYVCCLVVFIILFAII